MIGLDTNVLVRYLTQDDPAQAARASRVIDAAKSASLYVSLIVICELVWVLEDAYDQTRAQIGELIEKMLLTDQFVFEAKELLWNALTDYRSGKGDLSDYLIGRIAQHGGCQHTLTFDRALKNHGMFRLL